MKTGNNNKIKAFSPEQLKSVKVLVGWEQSKSFDRNLENCGNPINHCVMCGKKTGIEMGLSLHMDERTYCPLNTDNPELVNATKNFSSQYHFPIGSDCAKKLPKEFVHGWPEKKAKTITPKKKATGSGKIPLHKQSLTKTETIIQNYLASFLKFVDEKTVVSSPNGFPERFSVLSGIDLTNSQLAEIFIKTQNTL